MLTDNIELVAYSDEILYWFTRKHGTNYVRRKNRLKFVMSIANLVGKGSVLVQVEIRSMREISKE